MVSGPSLGGGDFPEGSVAPLSGSCRWCQRRDPSAWASPTLGCHSIVRGLLLDRTANLRQSLGQTHQTFHCWAFPGGPVVENLPANAGDTGLIPSRGRSHKPWSNEARLPQLASLCSRAHVLKPESSPHLPQLKTSLCTATKIQRSRYINK